MNHCTRLIGVATFAKSVVIDAPVETVFGFHERDDALTLITPRFPPVKIIDKSGGIQMGSRVELRIGPIPWIALHTAFEQNRLFVDEQIRGPFAKWIHRHEFEDLGGRTRLTDRVEYVLRGGSLLNAALGWLVRLGLRQMFRYRHKVTKLHCEV
jgi:ligand-binding SRPBCC domain-containing protein